MGVRNENELRNLIMPALKQATDCVVNEILTKNKELIEELVYGAYSPIEYQRQTGEDSFKEAWGTNTTRTSNRVEGEFVYEPKDTHHSIVDGSPVDEYLADIIFNGLSGAIYQQGYAKDSARFHGEVWTKKRDAWSALEKWLTNRQFRQIFENGMSKAGIPWKRNVGAVIVEKDKQTYWRRTI